MRFAAIGVILLSSAAFGQQAPPVPSFEVADVKPSVSGASDPGKGRILPGGRIEVPNITVKGLMMAAYGVQENMITGGPGWIDSDRFDIVAKAPHDTPQDKLRMMLQPLLADRFKLVFHHEDKPMSVFVLVVGKRGAKLQRATGSEQGCSWNQIAPDRIQRICHGLTMAEFAREIPGWGRARVDRPVVDLTELQGAYDFQLEWSVPVRREGDRGPDAPASVETAGTIFEAMDQIGLKLEARKLPMPVIVIDHAERPSAN